MAANSAVTDTNWSPNFDEGRPGGDPIGIVLHHWGVDGQSHDGVVNYLSQDRGAASTSAHYVASAGRVTQLVHDYDRAWHCAGNNMRTIGIECRPEASDEDYETVAQLVAAIRAEWGGLSLSGHSTWFATACPGRYTNSLDWVSNRANEINAGVDVPPAWPTPAAPGVAEDGVWGPLTTCALQAYLGTPMDGIVSEQLAHNRVLYPAASEASWEWVGDGGGSQLIRALQARVGAQVDGYAGYDTACALQARVGAQVDGYVGMETVSKLQAALNRETF